MVIADWEWSNFFQSIGGILFITFIFGGWIIVAVASTLAKAWRKAQESEHIAALKQGMIDKGMSAEDIERVLRAGPEAPESKGDPTVRITTKLAEHEVPAKTMEEILTAFRAADAGTRDTVAKSVASMLDSGADGERVLVAVRALC